MSLLLENNPPPLVHEKTVAKNEVLNTACLEEKKQPHLDKLIASFFFSRYKLVVASNYEEKKIGYETRHQVYCEEMQYEAKNEHALEQDVYDKRSVSCHIQHLPTGKCAGTIRLVLPKPNGEGLPVEDKFSDIFEDEALLPSSAFSDGVCEISRLAIPKEFRIRQLRSMILSSPSAEGVSACKFDIERLPYLSIALYLMATSICFKHGFRYAYVLMEPKLARRMRAFGINFKTIGSSVEFNGQRVPYRIEKNSLVSELAQPLRGFLKAIDIALENETQAAFEQIQQDEFQHIEENVKDPAKNSTVVASVSAIIAA